MFDLHSHILPGVDDGPDEWEDALDMLQMAAAGGTHTIVATPHSHDYWHGPLPAADVIHALVAEANQRVRAVGLPLEILPGQECRLEPELPTELELGTWLTLGGSRTVLLELPFVMWPPATEALIWELQLAGFIVLLAHPERYKAVHDDPNRLLELVEQGLYTQVTSTSIMGRFGKPAQDTARLLLEHDMAHVIASDAHTTGGRHTNMREAVELAGKWIGLEAAQRLVTEFPAALLADEELDAPEPRPIEPPTRKKLFGLF